MHVLAVIAVMAATAAAGKYPPQQRRPHPYIAADNIDTFWRRDAVRRLERQKNTDSQRQKNIKPEAQWVKTEWTFEKPSGTPEQGVKIKMAGGRPVGREDPQSIEDLQKFDEDYNQQEAEYYDTIFPKAADTPEDRQTVENPVESAWWVPSSRPKSTDVQNASEYERAYSGVTSGELSVSDSSARQTGSGSEGSAGSEYERVHSNVKNGSLRITAARARTSEPSNDEESDELEVVRSGVIGGERRPSDSARGVYAMETEENGSEVDPKNFKGALPPYKAFERRNRSGNDAV